MKDGFIWLYRIHKDCIWQCRHYSTLGLDNSWALRSALFWHFAWPDWGIIIVFRTSEGLYLQLFCLSTDSQHGGPVLTFHEGYRYFSTIFCLEIFPFPKRSYLNFQKLLLGRFDQGLIILGRSAIFQSWGRDYNATTIWPCFFSGKKILPCGFVQFFCSI